MKKEKIVKHLDNALEKQVPDVWNHIQNEINNLDENENCKTVYMLENVRHRNKKRKFYIRFSAAAILCLILAFTFMFTPAFAAIQNVIDKVFSSRHIDDTGLKNAIDNGQGQSINQTYYDKKHNITVHFESVMTDDKETKLLLTYQSKTTNLKNYYVDIFEGKSSINLIVGDIQKKLNCVGWGSRYYNSKENKVAEALSFESIKPYQGQDINLKIKDLTIYSKNDVEAVSAVWPLHFKLNKSAISDRKTVAVHKEFHFKNETYKIKKVEFSALETRVVVSGTDTKPMTDENGVKYRVMSELEKQFLNARNISKDSGYTYNDKKSGVYLKSAGKKVVPIFSKGEVKGTDDEYIMFFAPVKNRHDCVLVVGNDIKLPLIN